MKKILATLLLASSLCLVGCSQSESSGSAKGKLEGSGYTATIYNAEESKTRYSNYFNFAGTSLVDSIVALKGEDANRDYFLCFYFSDTSSASTFLDANIAELNRAAENNIGSNLTATAGLKNNAVYSASTVSFSVVF